MWKLNSASARISGRFHGWRFRRVPSKALRFRSPASCFLYPPFCDPVFLYKDIFTYKDRKKCVWFHGFEKKNDFFTFFERQRQYSIFFCFSHGFFYLWGSFLKEAPPYPPQELLKKGNCCVSMLLKKGLLTSLPLVQARIVLPKEAFMEAIL